MWTAHEHNGNAGIYAGAVARSCVPVTIERPYLRQRVKRHSMPWKLILNNLRERHLSPGRNIHGQDLALKKAAGLGGRVAGLRAQCKSVAIVVRNLIIASEVIGRLRARVAAKFRD